MTRLGKSQRRARIGIMALLIACVGITGVGVWRTAAVPRASIPPERSSEAQIKALRHARLLRGVGGQVRFAAADGSAETVKASVESAARFIFERSGLRMSEQTKNSLTKAEQAVLKGKGERISTDELTAALTSTASKHLATMTDAEIESAADSFRPNDAGEITVRASGKWGYLTKDEFVRQAKAGREWSRRGDAALSAALNTMLGEEVKERLDSLSAALPEQFGDAVQNGLTPTQALVVSYAVAADDPLDGSQAELKTQLIQQRITARMSRPDGKSRPDSGKAYGPRGFLNSSPAHLLLNPASVGEIIKRAEGGRK